MSKDAAFRALTESRKVREAALSMLSIAVPMWGSRMTLDNALDPAELSRVSDAMFRYSEALVTGREGCAEGFNALAESLARLSFCNGGVRSFGYRWTATKMTPDRWWVTQRPEEGVATMADQLFEALG